jgi:AmmeMemoRadiSam system protein A
MTGAALRRALMSIARQHLDARVLGAAPPPLPHGVEVRSSGVFVTLYCQRELRGCLGSLDGGGPVPREVARLAAAVCRDDERFPPLQPDELGWSEIEISLLSAPERVVDLSAIDVGRHGLIAERGWRKGLLLPQVARDRRWDRETFLTQTCLKAGLDGDAWRRDAIMSTFEAEIFRERSRD